MRFNAYALYMYCHKWSGHLLGKYCRACGITYKDFLENKTVCQAKRASSLSLEKLVNSIVAVMCFLLAVAFLVFKIFEFSVVFSTCQKQANNIVQFADCVENEFSWTEGEQ